MQVPLAAAAHMRPRPPPRAARMQLTCEQKVAVRPGEHKRLRVSFNLPYRCAFGQELCIVGAGENLGNWQVQNGKRMEWSQGDVWKVEFEVTTGANLELEYKYVVRNHDDGTAVAWKPGANYAIRVPVIREEERAVAEGVRVRDAWDGSLQDIELEVTDLLEAGERIYTAEEERAAVESAMNRALDELTEALNRSMDMAESGTDPTAPELLQADRVVAAATRKAVRMHKNMGGGVAMSRALQSSAPGAALLAGAGAGPEPVGAVGEDY